ncbi:MAG: hypothetical protein OHK0039_40710 [Bacteroidia bacterium]
MKHQRAPFRLLVSVLFCCGCIIFLPAQNHETLLAAGIAVQIESPDGMAWQTQEHLRQPARPLPAVPLPADRPTTEAQIEAMLDTWDEPMVPLADLRASSEDRQVAISWSVAEADEVKQYEIQRSPDGLGWESIGMMRSAAHGTPLETYTFIDPQPAGGSNYYRLKQVGQTGDIAYSDALAIALLPTGTHITHLYPHPLLFGTSIHLDLKETTQVRIAILDEARAPIAEIYAQRTLPGRHRIELDLQSLPPGDYLCAIEMNGETAYRYIGRR